MRSQIVRFFGLAALFAAGAAQAAPSMQTVVFTGQARENFTLTSTKYRTEYQERPVYRTCYRQEFRGYRTVCSNPPRPAPGPYPRPVPAPRPVCRQVPVYVQVPYTCTVIERIPVQVLDANVVANVTLNFGDLPQGVTANEAFTVTLNEDVLSISVKSSGKTIIASTESQQVSRNGNVINIGAGYELSFLDAAPALAAFKNGISRMSVVNGKISFEMNSAATQLALPYSLKVVKNRTLADDVLIFDRPVAFQTFRESPSNGELSMYSAAYSDIGLQTLGEGKYTFTLSSKFEIPGKKILNASQLPGALSASRTVVLKVN